MTPIFTFSFTIILVLFLSGWETTVVEAGGWTTVTSFSSPFNSHVLLNKDTAGDCATPFATNGTYNFFFTPEALQVSTTAATTLNALRATPYYFPVSCISCRRFQQLTNESSGF